MDDLRDKDDARVLREALQEAMPHAEDHELGVLRRYIVICEWTDPSGEECITHAYGDINDDRPAPWNLKGMLAHALDSIRKGEIVGSFLSYLGDE